jgi:Periplasmic protease
MKKIILYFFTFSLLFSVSISCKNDDPAADKGTLESAEYNASAKSFTLTYSSGFTTNVNAVIDNSFTPPIASATLEDGTVVSVNDANNSGAATISLSDEVSGYKYVNEWINEEMSIYYFWNDKLPQSPNYSLNPNNFFNSILYKYSSSNPEGDRFSWIQESYVDLLNDLSGVSSDEIGFDYIFLRINEAGTQYYALVLYTKQGTDAETKGIDRGRFITKIDGQDITPQNYRTLFGGSGTKRLSMADWTFNPADNSYYLQNSGDVTVQMHTNFAENPVYLDSVYTIGDKKIGYLVYNFFARDKGDSSYDYDRLLMNRLTNIQSKGITEMVLDLRYNSGGAVSSAIALASALVSNRSTSNILMTSQYNPIVHNVLLKEYGANYNKDFFADKIQTGRTAIDIPASNLSRLYVLTTGRTASASELVINGLKPYMEVILIGETTYGKNVGSISIYEKDDPKNKWGMQPIVAKYYNSAGNSDYTAGFRPNHEVDEFDIGGDDELFLYEFGDTADPLLGKAVSLITGITRSTRSEKISTPFRSSQVDKKATLNMQDRHRFEMYDDVRGDAIKELMKK